MERLQERINTAKNALTAFGELVVIDLPNAIERDACIQRFEFTFEACWKAGKQYLYDIEGIDVGSPKSVIRSFREINLFSAEEAIVGLKMVNDRNLTVHTYNEEIAIQIHSNLKAYYNLLDIWMERMKKESLQFTSLKEFDSYRSYLFYKIKDKLSKGALLVWNQLAQRSIEVPGVCWVQINTIAEAAGVSRSTVERAIRLFKKLGVIEVKETIRPKTGGDGANICVFQKLGEGAEMKGREDTPNPCSPKVDSPESKNDTKISLDLNKYINHLNTTRTPYIKYVPKSLQHFQAFFGKRIKDIYARVWLAAKKLGLKIDQATMQQIGFIAMETLKRYAKEGKSLSEEQQYKCAYVIAYKQLQQRIDNGEIIDFNNLYGSLLKKISMKKVYSPMLKNEDYTQLDELGVY